MVAGGMIPWYYIAMSCKRVVSGPGLALTQWGCGKSCTRSAICRQVVRGSTPAVGPESVTRDMPPVVILNMTDAKTVTNDTSSQAVVVHIVEDDTSVRDALSRLIMAAYFEPRTYASAGQFLSELRPEPRACLVLDITSRQEAVQSVRATLDEKGIDLPIIAVSAHDDDVTLKRARDLGARIFLRKPVDDQALIDAIVWVTGPTRRQGVKRKS
jgi:CheY-like chemotaxis protein